MIVNRVCQAATVLAAALALTACGGDTVVKVEQSTQISKGWELKDLQKALDAGAINRDEFERIKQKLLKRTN
ncbi:MAG: SHOCT domain-containing protein [Betaproteobacteria bacterium]|nr:SHOCT domain-containing protein [Betaproteobacteria bacterium]MBL8518109.1 SHOCT domain-containing protein [Betaproteobacteria bacterium]